MKTICLGLAAAFIAGCQAGPPAASSDADSPSIQRDLPGVWGRGGKNNRASCVNEPHTISFSDDGEFMLFTWTEQAGGVEELQKTTLRYRILRTGKTFRIIQEGERDRNWAGNLRVLDIVMLTRDSYCYRRPEWRPAACSTPRRRCPASQDP